MNKNSDFMRIRQYIVDSIVSHGNTPLRFPPTRELGRKFGVSQPTALRVVKDLIGEGFLTACKGGGTVSVPRFNEGCDLKIVGLLSHIGRQAFDTYFFMTLSSVVGLELMRRSVCYCTQQLSLEVPSLLEREVCESSIAALVLLAAQQPIPEYALNVQKSGLPVVSFFHRLEGISSFYVSLKDWFYDNLATLFGENRKHILIVGWGRPDMMGDAELGIQKACRDFMVPAGQVISVCQSERESYEKIKELLDFGIRFDGVIFYPCMPVIYDLIKSRLDTKEACRLVIDESSIHDDMQYTGYGVTYDLASAAKQLIDHLVQRMNHSETSIVEEKIPYHIQLYKGGVKC